MSCVLTTCETSVFASSINWAAAVDLYNRSARLSHREGGIQIDVLADLQGQVLGLVGSKARRRHGDFIARPRSQSGRGKNSRIVRLEIARDALRII